MEKIIVINSSTLQNRVAIIEDNKLVDFFVESSEKQKMVGDIYLGRVARVLPGIKAAFIDIGLKHDAFLHFSDIGNRLESLKKMMGEDSIEDRFDDEDQDEPLLRERQNREFKLPKLKKGEPLLIQILKEPQEGKGVRVTSAISLPGRFCVLIPYDNKIGVSKKIADFKERRRLKRLAAGIIPDNCGLIIRTAALEQTEENLTNDLKNLVKNWEEIQKTVKENDPPELVYKDLSTTSSIIRDLCAPDVNRIYVDSKKMYKEIRNYFQTYQPETAEFIELFKSDVPIFEHFGVEKQIESTMGRKVALPSGGHIVIDHTEAMIVIDVNSGKYAAKKEQELNSLKTDLEASREIVRQLRLRDIGGLVVIDFIDLEEEKNRKKIYDEIKKEFRKDRAKTSVLPMTDFGLIQITRQRIRENILQSMNESCPYCNGTGKLRKRSNFVHEIEERIKKIKRELKIRKIILKTHPFLGMSLRDGKISTLFKLQLKHRIIIKLIEDEKLKQDEYYFISPKTNEVIKLL